MVLGRRGEISRAIAILQDEDALTRKAADDRRGRTGPVEPDRDARLAGKGLRDGGAETPRECLAGELHRRLRDVPRVRCHGCCRHLHGAEPERRASHADGDAHILASRRNGYISVARRVADQNGGEVIRTSGQRSEAELPCLVGRRHPIERSGDHLRVRQRRAGRVRDCTHDRRSLSNRPAWVFHGSQRCGGCAETANRAEASARNCGKHRKNLLSRWIPAVPPPQRRGSSVERGTCEPNDSRRRRGLRRSEGRAGGKSGRRPRLAHATNSHPAISAAGSNPPRLHRAEGVARMRCGGTARNPPGAPADRFASPALRRGDLVLSRSRLQAARRPNSRQRP